MTLTQQAVDALLERQRNLEDNCLSRGQHRFRQRLESAVKQKAQSSVGAARKLLSDHIDPTATAIRTMIDEAHTPGRRGRRHVAVKWCELVGADVAAYITTKVVLDRIGTRVTARKAAGEIMELITDELRYRRFEEQAPALFKYRVSQFHTSNYAHMARSMDAAMRYASVDVSDLDVSQTVKIGVGFKLLDIFMQVTGLIQVEDAIQSHRGRVKRDIIIVATDDTQAWMTARNAALEFLWPVNLPMIVPPLQWGPQQRGGYRFAMRHKHTLVRGVSKQHAETIANTQMPVVYTAVNRIQETAWRINPHVLTLVQEIAEHGGALAGIPLTSDEDMPKKPHDIAENEAARKQWRQRAHAVKERNAARQGKAREFLNTLNTAIAVKDEAAIFFPCNLDFRGRVYPIVNYLSPQGDDLSKSLLTFADGKPLGEDGATWLATHGANCLGKTPDGLKLSACTLDERVQWIVQHTSRIARVASHPMADVWWTEADDPLQFFAFCCEWAAFAAMHREGKGQEYVCALPVAMDGTCNGLQHFAAMLRDEQGASAVNVIPQDRPNDIYQRIADEVTRMLEERAADNPLARLWIISALVDRKLCKRPTMTFGYGSKKYGFATQIQEYVQGLPNYRDLKKHFTLPVSAPTKTTIIPVVGMVGDTKSQLPAACSLMAGLIWDALELHVSGAFIGMDWMQTAARGVSANGRCVSWTVPSTGFPVRQEYMKYQQKQIQTVLAGKIRNPVRYDVTNKPNGYKQANAVSPNFIHSLDAACLMMTVQLASTDGVDSFGMVHDSYATVAADCAVLARATREAFYTLYTNTDVLAHLAGYLRQDYKKPEEFPDLPTMGRLDLGGVLVSDYFFS